MRILSVLAQKGGTGKTTLLLHWAVAELAHGTRVAVLDLDPQASAVSWGRRRASERPEILQASADQLHAVVTAARQAGVGLLMVDTMPHVEAPIANVARVSDLVIIPSGPSVLDIDAIADTVDISRSVRASTVIVLNQGRTGSRVNQKAVEILGQYGVPICPTLVMRRASLSDAFVDGRAVLEVEPDGKAAGEILESWSWIRGHLGQGN